MIRFEGVTKSFESTSGEIAPALRGVSLEVERGETFALIGTSGSGKTTLLKMINRLVEPDAGRVLLEGRDVREGDPIALRRGIGWVIQQGGVFPHLDLFSNLALLPRLEGWSRTRRRERVFELLEMVHLPPAEFAHRMPDELSGGQLQRVALARALVLDPDLVLMDEPFSALDPITRKQLHVEFLTLESRVHKTVVLVTHDLDEAFSLCDRIALLHEGELQQVGTPADFRERPENDFVATFVRSHASPEDEAHASA